jgi:septum formation protein
MESGNAGLGLGASTGLRPPPLPRYESGPAFPQGFQKMALVLASSSAIRRAMLEQAGLEFTVEPADVDEAAERRRHDRPDSLATSLAKAKALAVSTLRTGDWVIGSDSVASVDGRIFTKPGGRDEAAEHLRFFSGKTLQLTSAVALAQGGRVDWSLCDQASLQVRPLSTSFIHSYLDAEWPEVGYCVGVFRIEGRGVQLFDFIDGNYFTILGMPLIPLLGALRRRGELAA